MKNQGLNAVGIIAEYNPFHMGHAWQMKKAKELSGADYCIAAISGDFVQRGSPAIYDKYARTAMALEGGADLVLLLPSIFSVSSAEDFAACGIALLDRLGVVGSVCFGSECGDIRPLAHAAALLNSEPKAYADVLKERLKKGDTFPQARARALNGLEPFEEGFLSSPNNILAIEYVKAILKRGSSLTPITVLRQGNGYHDASIPEGIYSASALNPAGFCSALSIRRIMEEAGGRRVPEVLNEKIPNFVKTEMEKGYPISPDDFSTLLNAALLKFSNLPGSGSAYLDVSTGLAARIKRQCLDFGSFKERVAALKTRQYTYTRISRALLHIILDMTWQEASRGREADYAPYARVLGFRRKALPLLAEIKKRGQSPLITKTADAGQLLKGAAWEMMQKDFFCSHLYQAVVCGKYQMRMENEFTRSVLIKD